MNIYQTTSFLIKYSIFLNIPSLPALMRLFLPPILTSHQINSFSLCPTNPKRYNYFQYLKAINRILCKAYEKRKAIKNKDNGI